MAIDLSRAADLAISLVGTNGRTIATWNRHAVAHSNRLLLRLPVKARRAGHDIVVIAVVGASTHPKTLPVVLRSA